MKLFHNYCQMLRQEFAGYHFKHFSKDLMAGLTVAAVALPLALAFGVSSGADAGSGLITAIVAGLIMSLLAGAFYQISGPTGAMAAILISLIAKQGLTGVFLATLMAGVFLLLASAFHLGQLTAYIPMPVITGFTSGIAVIIALGQVDHFFGVTSKGATAVERVGSYFRLGFAPHWPTLAIGLGVVALLLLWPKKWNAIVPGSLVAIIFATAVVMVFQLDVKTVGAIPRTLLPQARLHLQDIRWQNISQLMGPALSICMLGMIESLLCGASAGRMTGVRLRSDQELFAQGIGNLILPFLGGIPATAAIARTSVAIKSGARTRLTGVIHGLFLMVSMFLLAPVMSAIPMSALAGVLIVTAWRMNEWSTIRYLFSHKFKGAILKYLVTLVATVLFDLTVAIVLGVAVALVLLVARLSKLEIVLDDVDLSRAHLKGKPGAARFSNAKVAYVTGPLLFASAGALEDLPGRLQGADTLLLSLRGMSYVDVTGIQALKELYDHLQSQQVSVLFCGVPDRCMEVLEQGDLVEQIGREHFYWSVERALDGGAPLWEDNNLPVDMVQPGSNDPCPCSNGIKS